MIGPSLYDIARERHADRLREAERLRLAARATAGRPGLAERLARRLARPLLGHTGEILIAIGRRLTERYGTVQVDMADARG